MVGTPNGAMKVYVDAYAGDSTDVQLDTKDQANRRICVLRSLHSSNVKWRCT